MSAKKFTVIQKLGEGAYSVVYKVQRIEDGQVYALKKVKLPNLSDKEKQNALNEVRILASIRHPNVIGYKEVFLEDNDTILSIVMEFCDDGDLFQKITQHQKDKTFFPEQTIWRIVCDIVHGLKALHDLKILHRDMKSANIFLTKDGQAKLGDMNVSKVAKKGMLYTQTGTPYYASPEVWDDKAYDSKSDIWSLGCVIYEMCTLKPPFRANDMEGLYKKVIKGKFAPIAKAYTFELHHLIDVMLQVEPSRRPTCDAIIQMPVLRKRLNQQTDELDEVINGLMNTIRIPKKLHNLQERLPKPNYSPLKMRPRENSASAMSFDNGNKVGGVTSQHSTDEIQSLPKIKRKLLDFADKMIIFDRKKVQVEENRQKKKRNADSIERIIQQRNERIRMIYGQIRRRRNPREKTDSKDHDYSQPGRINLPSLIKQQHYS